MPPFKVRNATLRDAAGIARVHTLSWQTNYRGLLSDRFLDSIDIHERTSLRRQILRERPGHKLVAVDRDNTLVAFCDGGPSRDGRAGEGEIYGLYLIPAAQRQGLGRKLFSRQVDLLRGDDHQDLHLWVLRDNHRARAFYEAMGGLAGREQTVVVAGQPVVKLSYHWDLRSMPRHAPTRHPVYLTSPGRGRASPVARSSTRRSPPNRNSPSRAP